MVLPSWRPAIWCLSRMPVFTPGRSIASCHSSPRMIAIASQTGSYYGTALAPVSLARRRIRRLDLLAAQFVHPSTALRFSNQAGFRHRVVLAMTVGAVLALPANLTVALYRAPRPVWTGCGHTMLGRWSSRSSASSWELRLRQLAGGGRCLRCGPNHLCDLPSWPSTRAGSFLF